MHSFERVYKKWTSQAGTSLIWVAVDTFLVNIGIGGAKDPTKNNLLQAMQNATPYDNKIKQTVRQAQKHWYKDVATNLESGSMMELKFGKGKRGGLVSFVNEANTFDHFEDQIILIILNSDDAKGNHLKVDDAIDATLFNI